VARMHEVLVVVIVAEHQPVLNADLLACQWVMAAAPLLASAVTAFFFMVVLPLKAGQC
jgi:hypothetical protein